MAWNPNRRKSELPANWRTIRARILKRDDYRCTATATAGQRCPNRATHVDHIVRGNDHSDENLRALCARCHASKTAREGNAARGPRPTQRRPDERHPGRLD